MDVGVKRGNKRKRPTFSYKKGDLGLILGLPHFGGAMHHVDLGFLFLLFL